MWNLLKSLKEIFTAKINPQLKMKIEKQNCKLTFLNWNLSISISALNWQSIWDRFDSSTQKNADLNDNDKFSYLQSFLCSSASESISGLTKTAENYTQKQPPENKFYKNKYP